MYLESHLLPLRLTALCTAAVVLQYEYMAGIIYTAKHAAASDSIPARASCRHFCFAINTIHVLYVQK